MAKFLMRVRCPGGCSIKVPEKQLGTVIQCPKCQCNFLAQPESDADTEIGPAFSSLDPVEVTTEFPDIISGHSLQRASSSQLSTRLHRSKQDRVLLARFLSLLLFLIGIINLTPAIYQWYELFQSSTSIQMSNWTYLQVLIAILQILYAVFLWQIQDWSALKAISVVMLVFAAFYGFVSTAFLTGDSNSFVQQFLGLPFSLIRTAAIWSVTMLLLSVATSFLAMKEALNWQRIEKIYLEIAAESTSASNEK